MVCKEVRVCRVRDRVCRGFRSRDRIFVLPNNQHYYLF